MVIRYFLSSFIETTNITSIEAQSALPQLFALLLLSTGATTFRSYIVVVLTLRCQLLGCIGPGIVGLFTRQKIERKYNLKRTGECTSFFCHCCCHCCILPQEYETIRELEPLFQSTYGRQAYSQPIAPPHLPSAPPPMAVPAFGTAASLNPSGTAVPPAYAAHVPPQR